MIEEKGLNIDSYIEYYTKFLSFSLLKDTALSFKDFLSIKLPHLLVNKTWIEFK